MLKVISGSTSSGKSLILAEKICQACDEGKKVIIFTNGLKTVFNRLALVSPTGNVTELTIKTVQSVSDLIKFLILNRKHYDEFFVDELIVKELDLTKLSGFVAGAGISLTVTVQTSKESKDGILICGYDAVRGTVEQFEQYGSRAMTQKIKEYYTER